MSVAPSIPVLETERLRLRAWREEDLGPFAEFCASEATARFVGGTCDRMGAWRRIATQLGHWTLRGYGPLAIEDKASGRFVGYSGLWNPEGWPEPELIWSLMADCHGRGYATEAARRVREFAYAQLGWHTLVSLIAPENAPSLRVAQRLGATFERDMKIWTFTLGIYRHPAPDQRHTRS